MKRFLKYISLCLAAAILFSPSVSAFSLNTKLRGGTKIGKDFCDLYGIHGLESSLQILIHPGLTVSTGPDISGNEYNFYQGTTDYQGTVTTGPPNYWTLTTNDYYPLEEIDDETGVTEHRLATVATGARYLATGLDISQYATESGNRQYRIVFTDSSGEKAWAYIGGADDAETLGAELYDSANAASDPNSNEADATTGWTEFGLNGTGSNVFESQGAVKSTGSYALHTDSNDTPTSGARIYQNIEADYGLVAGKRYELKFDARHIGSGGQWTCRISSGNDLGGIITKTQNLVSSDTTFQTITWTFTHITGVSEYFVIGENGTNDGGVYIDNISLKEVTHLGTDAVLLYDDPDGSNQNLTGASATFDPNDISTIEIYKTIGSDNLTGDVTYETVMMPADGQPAADQCIFGNEDNTAGSYGFGVWLLTTGKIQVTASSDGSTEEGVVTDDAVFTDGAQTSPKQIVVAYDASGSSIAVYVNGSAVAVSNLGGGGPSTSIYDNYGPHTIGASAEAANYFNGRKYIEKVFNTAVTAAQALDLYNSDATQKAING